jgi:hypothetical protein
LLTTVRVPAFKALSISSGGMIAYSLILKAVAVKGIAFPAKPVILITGYLWRAKFRITHHVFTIFLRGFT